MSNETCPRCGLLVARFEVYRLETRAFDEAMEVLHQTRALTEEEQRNLNRIYEMLREKQERLRSQMAEALRDKSEP